MSRESDFWNDQVIDVSNISIMEGASMMISIHVGKSSVSWSRSGVYLQQMYLLVTVVVEAPGAMWWINVNRWAVGVYLIPVDKVALAAANKILINGLAMAVDPLTAVEILVAAK
jgi:hypothetical protein